MAEIPANAPMDLTLEDAVSRILAAVPAPVAQSVALAAAHGRVLAERVLSPIDLPGFDNSSMDGYAVRSSEVAAARPEAPIHLRLAGTAAAGGPFLGEVTAGCCVRVATGALLPAGADAVVMQEDTRIEGNAKEQVLVLDAVKPLENVRLRGEDVKHGALIAEAGALLTAGVISLLGAAGVARVNVGRQPTVGLLATGSELREPGEELVPGQIHESNRLALSALAQQAGAVPKILPLVPDRLEAIREALEEAFRQSDAVFTTGGASVGEMDFVKQAFVQSGGRLDFWRVSIKPGRPFLFGRRGQKLLFGLPGNPVSAFVTFLLLVRPALMRWQGASEVSLPVLSGVLAEPVANNGDRAHFVRVRVDSAGQVFSSGLQASHALSSLAAANGLLEVPSRATMPAGSVVRVMRIDV